MNHSLRSSSAWWQVKEEFAARRRGCLQLKEAPPWYIAGSAFLGGCCGRNSSWGDDILAEELCTMLIKTI